MEWLCEDRWACLLKDSPAINRVHSLPRTTWRRNRSSIDRKAQDLSRLLGCLRHRYHAIIDAQGLAKSALLARAIGSPVIGHRRPRAREGSHFLHQVACPCDAEHVIDQQRALGLPLLGDRHPGGGWVFPLPVWPKAQERMDSWLVDTELECFWGLNVGAGWPSKCWPIENQIAFARMVLELGHRLLIIWGNTDELRSAEEIATRVPGTKMAPPTELPELAALLRRCAVLVSGDTGPLHLARALGTPAIGLFGPVPARRNGVRGPRWVNLQAPSDPWERRDPRRTRMDRIDPLKVCELASDLAR